MSMNSNESIQNAGEFAPKGLFGLRDYFLLPFSEVGHEQAKLHWIVRLRWLIIGFLTALAPVGLVSGVLTRETIFIYGGILGMLFAFNLLTQRRWFERQRVVRPILIAYQLTIDLVVLAGLLLLTGGISNPFYVLFFVNVSLGSMLLDGRRSVIFLVICHQILFLVQVLSHLGGLQFLGVGEQAFVSAYFIQHLVLLISWGVSRSLGRYISLQQERLSNVKVVAEKLDRLRSLGALTAGFSHEFASPLNTLKLRLAREMRQQPESANLQEMQMAILECEAVIRKMNSAQMDPRQYDFKDLRVVSVTEEILRTWKNENSDAVLKMTVEKPEGPPLLVTLPLLNYAQALMNLLDNAFESHPEGEIKVVFTETSSHVVLGVENIGPAFSQDVLARFGEPFVTTKKSGTGLGLYSVQLFAQSVGGQAYLKNTERGARVEIHFPESLKRGGNL
ncbi:Sensor histidine kinase RegB [compost metagenome]